MMAGRKKAGYGVSPEMLHVASRMMDTRQKIVFPQIPRRYRDSGGSAGILAIPQNRKQIGKAFSRNLPKSNFFVQAKLLEQNPGLKNALEKAAGELGFKMQKIQGGDYRVEVPQRALYLDTTMVEGSNNSIFIPASSLTIEVHGKKIIVGAARGIDTFLVPNVNENGRRVVLIGREKYIVNVLQEGENNTCSFGFAMVGEEGSRNGAINISSGNELVEIMLNNNLEMEYHVTCDGRGAFY